MHKWTVIALVAVLAGCTTPDEPTPSLQWPAGNSPTILSAPIIVEGVYDGQGRVFAAAPVLGDGSQDEGQSPLFKLRPGATLRNVVLAAPAADGVHVEAGDGLTTTVEGCWWLDVGEDALSIVSGDGDGRVIVRGCRFRRAADKVVQINANPRVFIFDCWAEDFGIFLRTNGTPGAPDLAYRIEAVDCTLIDGRIGFRLTNSRARAVVERLTAVRIGTVADARNGAAISVR